MFITMDEPVSYPNVIRFLPDLMRWFTTTGECETISLSCEFAIGVVQ